MLKWFLLTAFVILLGWWLIPYLESEESQVLRHHHQLVEALRKGDTPALRSLLGENFEFHVIESREEALELFEEKGSLFRAYQFDYQDPKFLQGPTNTLKEISQHIQVFAKPNSPFPPPQNVPTQAWTFQWKKADAGLAKWELIRVTNPEFKL